MSSEHNTSHTVADPISADLSLAGLKKVATWIRDELDPVVAVEGPDVLKSDDVLTLHTLLLALQCHKLSMDVLRFSRIFLAVRDICSKATRWPGKLIDEAELVIERWEASIGPLKNVRTPLYEKGARLDGICDPSDTDREAKIQRWANSNPKQIDDRRAYMHGNLGFLAGKWWINGLFAFRDGIISSMCTDEGLTATRDGAYALVLIGNDETNAPSPSSFTYRCRNNDGGRFRLTAGDYRARYPVRVLRDHRLVSLWAPRAGIRYDGLYKVVGWTVRPINPDKNDGHRVSYDVRFESEETSIDWNRITQIPNAEETDDYKMYKIIHRERRDYERRGARNIFESPSPAVVDERLKFGSPLRSMSICEVVGLGKSDGKQPSCEPNMPSDHSSFGFSNLGAAPENASLVDGSSDRGYSPISSRDYRHDRYSHDLFTTLSEGPNRTLSSRNLTRAPLGFSAVEPFNTLRANTMLDRRSYDGSEDDPPRYTPSIDTRFRPVNWNPGPKLHLAPAIDVSDEALNDIAPFSDLRRRSLNFDSVISPKTSVADIKTRSWQSRSLSHRSVSEAILEREIEIASTPLECGDVEPKAIQTGRTEL